MTATSACTIRHYRSAPIVIILIKLFHSMRNIRFLHRSDSDDDRRDKYGFTDKFYDRLAEGIVIASLAIVIYLIRSHSS